MNVVLWSIIISILVYAATSVNYTDDVLNERLIISLERPKIIKEHPQIIHVVNVTSRQIGRSDPHHYVHMCYTLYRPFDNSVVVNIKVTENKILLYSIPYLEVTYKFCDFLKMLKFDLYFKENITEPFVRSAIKHNKNNCLLVPGTYYFTNALLPKVNFPANFPLQSSRLFFNLTYKHTEIALLTQIDLELKPVPKRRRKN